MNNGWTHPDPKQATKEVIIPLVTGLLGMLVLPAAAVWGIREFFDLPLSPKFMCKWLYSNHAARVLLTSYSYACISRHVRHGRLLSGIGGHVEVVVLLVTGNQG
jgi:hypothetical protein